MVPCFSLPLAGILLLAGGQRTRVEVLHPPDHGEVPEAVWDCKGVLHLTYGKGAPGNAFYTRSADGGNVFTRPVRLNRRADTVTVGGERGPKLAVGKDGVIHVVWLGHYQRGGGVWYTRSTDGGRTFEPERDLRDPAYGTDNATVAADAEGNVVVLWTGGWPGLAKDQRSPYGAPMILARSADNGRTFSHNELVRSDYPGRACECCRLEARMAADGNLYVAFRGSYQNQRDPFLLKGKKAENDFKAVAVSADGWKTT